MEILQTNIRLAGRWLITLAVVAGFALFSGCGSNSAVAPANATKLTVTAPASTQAGSPVSVTVTATDDQGNTVPSYAGSVVLSSSDAQAVLPLPSTLTNGTGVFSITFKTSGTQTITARDSAKATITGSAGPINVTSVAPPPSATKFKVAAPASATAGTAIQVTVTATDDQGNTVPGYSGSVRLTSSDGLALLPPASTLTNGFGVFAVTLKTNGPQTVTAVDSGNAAITGTTGSINVTGAPTAATKFKVTAPASATAGSPISVNVTATDDLGNTATTYAGTVHFTSSDGLASLPLNSTLTNGAGGFSVTLRSNGSQTVTATDSANSAITGTTGAINVTGAPPTATKFKVTAPASAMAGSPISVNVTATDDLGNVATSYAGTVKFTSSDGSAILPPDSTLTNGTGVFSAKLNSVGNKTITATDIVVAAITGTSGPISVTGTAAPVLSSLSPSSVTAGSGAFTLSVNGSNFVSGATVLWNGTSRTTSFISAGQLQASIAASDVASAGTAQVTAQNPDLTTSNALAFAINAPVPPGGVIALISANDAGTEANNASSDPMITPDGRFVAFISGATDILAPDNNLAEDSYVRDNCAGSSAPANCVPSIVRTDQSTSNVPPLNGVHGGSLYTSVSSDGQVAYFGALSQDTFPSFDPFPPTLFGRAICLEQPTGCAQATFIATLTSTGGKPNGNVIDTSPISISDDGRYLGFTDTSTNMTPDVILAPPLDDVEFFLRDTCVNAVAGCTPTTILVSESTAGDSANSRVFVPRLSGTGRFATFNSVATNLVPGVVSGNVHAYLRDTCIGAPAGCTPSTILIDAPFDGSAEPNSPVDGNEPASVSDDGRYVLFSSDASNLVAPGSPFVSGNVQTYLRDTCVGAGTGCAPSTQLISEAGGPVHSSFTNVRVFQALSSTGRYAAFQGSDVATPAQVFVRDTCIGAPAGCVPSISIASADPNSIAGANSVWGTKAYLSRDGHFIALTRINGTQQIFLAHTGF